MPRTASKPRTSSKPIVASQIKKRVLETTKDRAGYLAQQAVLQKEADLEALAAVGLTHELALEVAELLQCTWDLAFHFFSKTKTLRPHDVTLSMVVEYLKRHAPPGQPYKGDKPLFPCPAKAAEAKRKDEDKKRKERERAQAKKRKAKEAEKAKAKAKTKGKGKAKAKETLKSIIAKKKKQTRPPPKPPNCGWPLSWPLDIDPHCSVMIPDNDNAKEVMEHLKPPMFVDVVSVTGVSANGVVQVVKVTRPKKITNLGKQVRVHGKIVRGPPGYWAVAGVGLKAGQLVSFSIDKVACVF